MGECPVAVKPGRFGLARSAYQSRYDAAIAVGHTVAEALVIARSPAVDAGSRDYLSAGWTRTDGDYPIDTSHNAKADNPAPDELQDPENLPHDGVVPTPSVTPIPVPPYDRVDPADLIPWKETADLYNGLRLDMGYHYGGAKQFKRLDGRGDPVYVYRTLRHPKERVSLFTYSSATIPDTEIENVKPEFVIPLSQVNSQNQLSIVSGAYTPAGQEDATCAVYAATGTTTPPTAGENVTFAAYWFRYPGTTQPDDIRRIAEFSYRDGDQHQFLPGNHVGPRRIVAVASEAGPPYNGVVPIYAACVTQFAYSETQLTSFSDVDVFRFDDGDQQWYRIATIGVEWPGPPQFYVYLTNVALAAQGGDLWVTWIKDEGTSSNPAISLYGCRIPGAYESKGGTPTPALSANLIQTIDYHAESCLDLRADWDEKLPGSFIPGPTPTPPAPTPTPVPGLPRVVYVNDEFDSNGNRVPDGTLELDGARVRLDSFGQPTLGLDQPHRIDDYTETPLNPAFAVNAFDSDRFPNLVPDDRGFIGYEKNPQASQIYVWKSPLTVDGNGFDQYGPNAAVSTDETKSAAVAPRAFGLARRAYVVVYDSPTGDTGRVHTGDAVFDAAADLNRNFPHLEAERARKDNVFLVHSGSPVYGPTPELDLYQLQP